VFGIGEFVDLLISCRRCISALVARNSRATISCQC
jgi:hypothetical protein